MRLIYSALLTASLLSVLPSRAEGLQPGSIGVPSLGYVYDRGSASLRKIAGTPGAAVLEEGAGLGFPVSLAAVASEYLLALSEDGSVRIVRAREAASTDIPGAMQSVSRIALSPSGTAALLYDEPSARLQILTGLPDRPEIVREFSTSQFGNATLSPAVSDDGALVVFGGTSLWLLNGETGSTAIALEAAARAVAFRAGSREAFTVVSTGDLFRIEQDGTVSKFGHAAAATPESAPVSVQVSPDGTRGYAAFEDGTLAIVDAADGQARYVSCQCRPSGLQPVNSSKMFRVNEPSASSPLLLLDDRGAHPRLWFVPAVSGGKE